MLAYFFSVYKFIGPTLDKTEWPITIDVKCGWNKEWDPPVANGCVDPRGCQPPPARTSEIWYQPKTTLNDTASKSWTVLIIISRINGLSFRNNCHTNWWVSLGVRTRTVMAMWTSGRAIGTRVGSASSCWARTT